MRSSSAAKNYFAQSDYYKSCPGDWLGKGAEMLGLVGSDNPMHFHSLADNLDPRTGNSLTTHTKDGRRVGMDLTFNSTKSVGIARELAGPNNEGDPRIEAAHREAVAYAMSFVEKDMQARVRVGGADHDRTTGNMVAYRVTHRDTRISAEDQKPDMSLHCHVFVFNATYDNVEDKWKAAQMGQIKHDACYYESIFHNRLASNLRDLGYGIRRKDKAFEIAGVSDELVKKFSRRSEYIKSVAAKLGITSAKGRDKLGATTRLGKSKELVEDLNSYFVSRLNFAEKQQLTSLIGQKSYVSNEEKAVAFAIGHTFERQSVCEERRLYETAIRHGIGSVTPEGVITEAKRQGVLLKDGSATTKFVLAEEAKIIDFAREGRGKMRPLGIGQKPSRDETRGFSPVPHSHLATTSRVRPDSETATLSPEQQALVSHILESSDQLILNIGDAGTGKTHAIKSAFTQIHCPIEMLAPSADASRGVLRKEGFVNADTVSSFLLSAERQSKVKNGVIWVDESGLLAIRDLSRLTDIAKQQNARLVLQGDPKQHKSVVRHGDMMNVLQEYAGLPVGRLTEIWRQKHKGYKRVVADIANGGRSEGFDGLVYLGWVQKVDSHAPLVDEYMQGLNAGKEMLVVAPTHAEGDSVTAAIRSRLQDEGKLGTEERLVTQLVPLNWTEAERDDLERYDGTEVLCFHRNSGTFRAGQTVSIKDWKPGDHWSSSSHFSVHRKEEIGLVAGDLVRITAGGKTLDGHKMNNGAVYRVKGFDKHDNLILANGWTVKKDWGHLNYGYASTSHSAQGKTVDRVLIAMGSESRGAVNAEQFYVSVSRGRESAKVFSDMPPEELKQAINRTDGRQSATELMQPKPKKRRRLRDLMRTARERFKALRARVIDVTKDAAKEKERMHGAYER